MACSLSKNRLCQLHIFLPESIMLIGQFFFLFVKKIALYLDPTNNALVLNSSSAFPKVWLTCSFLQFFSPSFIRTVKYWCYCTTMERNVRRRIRLVCPGCDDMFHSQHSFNLHLLSSEFCYFVDQCGVNTNQPSSNQQFPTSGNGINDSSKLQSKGPVPYELVSDQYRVSLDDYIPSEIQVNDTDFQPNNEINA